MSMDTATRTALQRVSDPFGTLTLLTITGDGLSVPVRVVNDARGPDTPTFVSRGNPYVALPFAITMPKASAKEVPRSQLRMDNVGREMAADLEALPIGAELRATVEWVHRARPDHVFFGFAAPLTNVVVTVFNLTASIGQGETLRRAAVQRRFDPFTAPGMFPG